MKTTLKKISHTSFFLLFAFILSACSKDSSNTIGPWGYEFTVDSQKYSFSVTDTIWLTRSGCCVYYESENSANVWMPTGKHYIEGIAITSKPAWQLGSIIFDNKSDLNNEFILGGSSGGTSLDSGSSVTLTITEKGNGRNSHVKGNFSGTIINQKTLKPMTISGTLDLYNVTK